MPQTVTRGPGLRRRALFSLPVVCLASGALASCSGSSGSPEVPEGWVRKEKGLLSVAVPPEWYEVTVPESAHIYTWDWVIQDREDFDDSEVTIRLGAMTQGPSAVLTYPSADAAEVAQELGSFDLFGQGNLSDPEPHEVEGGEDEVQRVDMPYGDGAGSDYLLVAKDEDSELMVVVGLTGPGVSEELIAGIAAGIQVIVPEG